jgi:hypothetical protein
MTPEHVLRDAAIARRLTSLPTSEPRQRSRAPGSHSASALLPLRSRPSPLSSSSCSRGGNYGATATERRVVPWVYALLSIGIDAMSDSNSFSLSFTASLCRQ